MHKLVQVNVNGRKLTYCLVCCQLWPLEQRWLPECVEPEEA